jgi:hypothetical protein
MNKLMKPHRMGSKDTSPSGPNFRQWTLRGLGVLLSLTVTSAAAVSPTPHKTSPVAFSWFYKPPADGTPTDKLSTSFHRFILTRNDEDIRDQLKLGHPKTPILQYVRMDAIEDPCDGHCPCTNEPWKNQVAWNAGDFCAIQKEHPDWFLKNKLGKPIYFISGEKRHVWMDPAHEGWQQFWLSRVKEAQETWGWEGVFLDNVQASLGQFQKDQIELQDYAHDEGFQTAVKSFLEHIKSAYFSPQGRPIEGNIIFLPFDNEKTTWSSYITHLDGAMLEDFAVGWQSGAFMSSERWLDQLESIEASQQSGKWVTLVSQGNQDDQERQTFALASYLLVADGLASFRYTNSRGNYNEFWWYDNYQSAKNLGSPIDSRTFKNGQWERTFEHGRVSVDPISHQGKLLLDVALAADNSHPRPR